MANSQKLDSSDVVILGNTFPKKFRKSVKLENQKFLVIVVSVNLTEIRPLQSLAQNVVFSKMGLIGCGDFGKHFSKKFRKSVTLEKQKIPRNCSGRKSDRNPPTTIDCAEMENSQKWDSSDVVILGNTFPKSSVKA